MSLAIPDWLQHHGGSLRTVPGNHRWLVLFNGDPVYSLVPVPVAGKFGCDIRHVNSGAITLCSLTAETPEAAVKVGLEDLRKALGW